MQEPMHLPHELRAVKSRGCLALKEQAREEQYRYLLSWMYLFTFLLNASSYWYTLIFVCPVPLATLDPISLLLALERITGTPWTPEQDAQKVPRRCSSVNRSDSWLLYCMLMQNGNSTKKHQNSPWIATFFWTLLYRSTGNQCPKIPHSLTAPLDAIGFQ